MGATKISRFYELCKPYFLLILKGMKEMHVNFMRCVNYKNLWIL